MVPDYDFRSLSPLDFEHLARDLLNAELGATFETFAVGRDGGIDIRDGSASTIRIGQCKHRPDLSRAQLLKIAAAEVAYWADRSVDEYRLIVSADPSPDAASSVTTALRALPTPAQPFLHRGTLNALLVRHQKVERAHFKLWLSSSQVLAAISAAPDWARSEALLQRMQDRVRLHVVTAHFSAATAALNEHGSVVLAGAPGAGKSTLAELLVLAASEDGWAICTVAGSLEAAWRAAQNAEGRTVVYYDDFLGQSGIAEVSGSGANDLRDFIDHVSRRKDRLRLVMTSRSQVLGQASTSSDDRIRRLAGWAGSRIIQVSGFTRAERAQLLFNHLYFATVDGSGWQFRTGDRRFFAIVDHANFNPRIIESVVLKQHHSTVDALLQALGDALDHPEEVWAASFQQLSDVAIHILLALTLLPASGVALSELYEALGHEDGRDWSAALKVLEGSWIQVITERSNQQLVSLYDGSRRDYLLTALHDQAVLDIAIDHTFRAEQLAFLGRSAVPNRAHNTDSDLARAIAGRKNRIADRVPHVVQAGWGIARRDSDRRRAFNRRQRTSVSNRYFLDSGVLLPQIEDLQAVAELLNLLPPDRHEAMLVLLLDRARQLLVEIDADRESWGISAAVVGLAVVISTVPDPRAEQLAADLAVRAARDALGMQDITDYVNLPGAVRALADQQQIRSDLRRVLEAELDDVLGELDDPDDRRQLVDDVETFAARIGVIVYTDSYSEAIDEYASTWIPKPSARLHSDVAVAATGESDDDLTRLFDLLA